MDNCAVDDSADAAPARNDMEPSVVGASMEIDIHDLDDETQRFIFETHLENIGVYDFLGFELASLASQYSDYSKLPNVGAARGIGGRDKMGAIGAFITTLKSFIGLGVLTLPFAMRKGGIILGPIALLFLAGLSYHCMMLLLDLATSMRSKTVSFGALGNQIAGRKAKIVVENCLLLTQYGFAIADLIFIVENVTDVVCLETRGAACPSKASMCAGVILFLLPLTWLRSLAVLTVPVLMSNGVLLLGISWVYYCAFMQMATEGIAPDIVAFNWGEFPVFFGCAVFSFEGIGLVLPIHFAMAKPSDFPMILRRAMILLTVLFTSFGIVCYAAYGGDTRDMITFNIPKSKITSFLRLFYCLGIFCTYPVMLFPLYQIAESKCQCLQDSRRCWRRVGFRTALVVLSGVIGLQIPHFGLFLGLIGSLACSALAFVLPAVFHLKRPDRENATRLGDAKDICIVIFGIVGGIIAFAVTLSAFFTLPAEGEAA
eukprot:TRINITY_DN16379_c0_g1_i1.p1 TRINITY_DN16379_c0_g1~~TRINITY_DN16379_c0_g1_i1.p1  ORF type:complete len:486 (+),score=78.47 TRINITY_DN16379_c0_g1_i1:234-1691(+)